MIVAVPTEKLSATVDAEVLAQVRALVGPRGFSAFVDQALRRELERHGLRALLADLEAESGPVDPVAVEVEAASIRAELGL